jgi:hypothetical protein
MGLVIGKDAAGPKGTAIDGGVQDVDAGLVDGALGCVIDAKRDQKGKREEDHLVDDGGFLEVLWSLDVKVMQAGPEW